MKKNFNLYVCVLTVLAALTFTGCLDSDEPGMQLHTFSYVRQTEQDYRPYFVVRSDREIQQASFSTPSSTDNLMDRVTPYVWEYEESKLTPNVSYNVTAVSPTGETASESMTMHFGERSLGDIRLDTFAYNADSGELLAKWNQVDSANVYCLMFCLEVKDALYDPFPRYYYNYLQWGAKDGEGVMGACPLPFTIQYFFGIELKAEDRVKVAVVAAYENSDGYLLLRESEPAIVTIGTSEDFLK